MFTILSGENGWAIKREADKLVDAFLKEQGELVLERFEGEDTSLDQVVGALTSVPFLASKKLVVLRRATENSELTSGIEKIVEAASGDNDLLLVEGKLDKRSVYYKSLKKVAGFKEFTTNVGPGLAAWCVDEAEIRGASLSRADAAYLVERVGSDQSLLAQEIDKLATYDGKITRQTINLLTDPTPESSIFDLLSAAFSGQHKKALELYEQQRAQKVEPFAILSMIGWQLHQIALAKTSGESSASNLARKARLSPYSAEKALSLSRNMTLKDIKEVAADLVDIEYRAKTSSYDIDEALRTLIVGF
jgi:DNA polymerase-3 subunit delta